MALRIKGRLFNFALAASTCAVLALSGARHAAATVTAQGSVSPTPAAGGGNVAAPFFIGDSAVGTLTINGGTPLSVTGGNSTWVGDDATGVGIATATGLGSNFNAGADLHIGNAGVGSVLVQNLAQVSAADDFILGEVAGSTGNLFVDALGSIAAVGDDIVVGQAGQALVQITAGGRVTADAAVLGQAATADGTVTVSGNTSLWDGRNTITIGDAGRGSLQVVSQARAETAAAILGGAASGVGVAEVSGASSLWTIAGTLNVGVAGEGTARVNNGGRAAVSGAVVLAGSAASEGRLEVTGANSAFTTASTLTVGNSGLGTFYVLNGGRASSLAATLGDQAAGRAEVIVDGDGSAWEITGALLISEPGEARMSIANAGRVSTTGGATVGASGQLLLSGGRLDVGSNALTNNGLVLGGGRITANVTNAAGGQIRTDAAGALTIAGNFTNAGAVSLEGGQLQINGATTNSRAIHARSAAIRFRGGLTNNAGGQFAVVGGSVDVFGAVTNNVDGQIVVAGGATAIFHDSVTNNDELVVMPGADVVLLDDLGLGATSSLLVQLGAVDLLETTGQLEVAGAATLGGSLEVSLASHYQPAAGHSFRLLTAAGGRTGAFASTALPTLAAGLTWNLEYRDDSVLLSVAPGLTADFNADGRVDAADLAVWKIGFGTTAGATPGQGDADRDGDVDGADFLSWQRQLGSGGAAAPSAAAVPEPAAAWLLLAATPLGVQVGRASRR